MRKMTEWVEQWFGRAREGIADLVSDRPWLAIALGLALFLVAAAGLSRIQLDFSHRGFFWPDDPELTKFDAFERKFGNDDVAVIAVESRQGVFTMETAALVQTLTARMWKIPEVIRVESIANFPWVHADGDDIKVEPLLPDALTPEILAQRAKVALAHEVVPGYLVSRDGKTALVFARIKPGLDRPSDSPLVYHTMEKLAKELETPGHKLYVSGSPAVIASFAEVAGQDTSRVFGLAMLVTIVALFYSLRTVGAVVMPLVSMFLCIIAVFGFSGWAGLLLNNIASAVPSILLAVCIGDAVHIIVTFNAQRRAGHDRREAARVALRENMLPTFLTSFTTSLGFLSFASVDVRPIQGLGYMMAFGSMFAWIETYLLVGGALVVLPSKIRPVSPETEDRIARERARRYVEALVRKRHLVIAAAVAIMVVSGLLASRIEVNSDPFKYFAPNVPVRHANEFIEKAVGGARGLEVVVTAGAEDGAKDPAFLRKVDELQKWIEKQPGITRVVSVLDALKATHRSLNGDKQEFYRIPDDRAAVAQELFLYTLNLPQGMDLNDRVTLRNDAIRLSVLWTIPTSREVLIMAESIKARGKEMGLDTDVTGKYYVFDSMNRYVAITFLQSFATASFTIGLVMLVVLRSVKLTIVSLLPNILPVIFGGAILALLRQPLDMGTVMVASVCLGVAVDDTVHVLVSFKDYVKEGMSAIEAMSEVFAHHTRAVVVNTVILSLSFGAFLAADFTPNMYFGVLTGLILAFALVCDLTLTPVLLTWPSKGKTPSATRVPPRDPMVDPEAAANQR